MRIRAVYKSLYHGILPHWMYEKQRHYNCSYLYHLWINIKYALRWMTFKEDQSDIDFEIKING
jgi:hypothetical protein